MAHLFLLGGIKKKSNFLLPVRNRTAYNEKKYTEQQDGSRDSSQTRVYETE
jgi:hypothetical protein